MSDETVETRGNERHDLIVGDTNKDGKADLWATDTDGDGKADLFQFDTDGDGKVDITMVDLDQDGTPDKIVDGDGGHDLVGGDRKSTRLNSSHSQISYAVFCL